MNAEYTGNQISGRRKALGLTQKQLAEQLHVTDKAVSKWERGINFPDLGLMENLAAALETTPAELLGLEDANRDEIVKNMALVHEEQLGDAWKHLRFFGWAALAVAVLLVTCFIQDRIYWLLGFLVPGLVFGGFYLLFRFGAIRAWDGPDMLIFLGCLLPILIFNLGYLIMDYGFPDGVNLVCILISTVCAQWLCYRTMNAAWAKALPLLGMLAYALWHLSRGGILTDALLCAAVSLAAWLILRRLDKYRAPLPARRIAALSAIGPVLFGLLYYDSIVKAYVHLRQDHLIAYCEELLDSGAEDTTYGLWDVYVYPEEGMVEFHTGGAGFGSETRYEGFYYSANDAHIPLYGADLPVDIYENTGWWTDGTDNHGTTQRLRKYFYWFEAYF